MDEAETFREVQQGVRDLVGLVDQPQLVYESRQSAVALSATDAWTASLNGQAYLLVLDQLKKLNTWLKAKVETCQTALNNKTALHFDVLMLGIVSTTFCLCGPFLTVACVLAQLPVNPAILGTNLVSCDPPPSLHGAVKRLRGAMTDHYI